MLKPMRRFSAWYANSPEAAASDFALALTASIRGINNEKKEKSIEKAEIIKSKMAIIAACFLISTEFLSARRS